MKLFDGLLTPTQMKLIKTLLTEEVMTNRLGEQHRAKTILKKMEQSNGD